jgi:hypothetical protein
MRTTIEIDDKLLKEALALTKAKTKKELIHRSLEALIRHQRIGLYDATAFDMVWGEVGRSLRRAGIRTKSDVNRLVKEVRSGKRVTKGGG